MVSAEQGAIEDLATRIFGSHEKALKWLHGENKRMNGGAPIELLERESGADEVRQMLHQIDEGMFA